ncbi:putative efflux protein, MATE family [Butyrivibrio fibrisolvens DSM 3071]|uniref:Putative efflux protein, MATE family n=1 Tax=Butyrivibrio fibrisolvens DSM 3071 TaxID=1121131 RepID=A0A1M6D256_BUTFI|nr:MATE family efflux transporter [Butyrivibrio fibrisolvens]SHI67078.1 putative efflux protein, MATE family [Butyrivibrio fibrisolvens DSM 3071]
MTKDKDLTVGNPLRLISSFAASMMIGNIFQQLYTVVDSIIIGKKIGSLGIAAIGGTDWLIFLVNGFLIGLIQGFSVLLGNKFGEKNEQAFDYYYKKARKICIAISVSFVTVLLLCSNFLLTLIGTKAEAFDFAKTYVDIIFMGIPFLVFYQFFAATLRSRGNSHVPLIAMTVSSLCNIALDYLFICIFHMGIAGAALGTILSECVVMIICGYSLYRSDMGIHRVGTDNSFKVQGAYNELIFIGLPMALKSVITAIGGLIVIRNVNNYDIDFLTGYTIAGKIYALLEIAASSYGMAVVAYVSQNHGAGHKDRIRSGVRYSLVLGVITALICSVIMIFFGERGMSLFVENKNVSPDVFMYGREYLFVLGLFYPLLYILYIVRSALQGIGNTFVPMISSFGQLIMRVFCAVILTKLIGCSGIYYGEISAWVLADLILISTYIYQMYIRNSNR